MRRRPASVALAAGAAFLAAAVSAGGSPAAAQKVPTYCPTDYVAHRGEGWNHPNTEDGVNAIRAAIEDPHAYGVESDAWETSDGKALMQHSDVLSVDTNGTGAVSSHTLAYIQSHYRMKDGSVPQGVRQYLDQVVHGHEHAILHLKSSSLTFDKYVNMQLTAAHAHQYVRPMATSLAQAKFFVQHGWTTELLVNGAATAAEVAAVKAAGVKAVLVVDTSYTATPASWIEPYIRAGISTDYVAYSAAQNGVIDKYAFSRVLSSNIATSAAASRCPAARK